MRNTEYTQKDKALAFIREIVNAPFRVVGATQLLRLELQNPDYEVQKEAAWGLRKVREKNGEKLLESEIARLKSRVLDFLDKYDSGTEQTKEYIKNEIGVIYEYYPQLITVMHRSIIDQPEITEEKELVIQKNNTYKKILEETIPALDSEIIKILPNGKPIFM